MSSTSSKTHDEAMARLCFICGKISGGGTQYAVKDHNTMLEIGFLAKDSTVLFVPGVTPTYFCHCCYRAVSLIEGGETFSTAKVPIEWKPHRDNFCSSCNLLLKKKCGGRKKR